jgi:hypothetical protein
VVIFKGMIREMTYNREITSDRETTYRLALISELGVNFSVEGGCAVRKRKKFKER